MNDFPLYKHATGQWCKTVKARKYYFGVDKDSALRDWLARKDGILAGLDNLRVEATGSGVTLGELASEFAGVLQTKLKANKIADETWLDYKREINQFVNVVGGNAIASHVGPQHFTAYCTHLIVSRKLGPHRFGAAVRYVRGFFNWAAKNGRVPAVIYGTEFVAPDTSPEALSVGRIRAGGSDEDEPIFEGCHIDFLLEKASPNFRAMILLSLNTGMGPSDVARLRWKHIKGWRLTLKRRKTGIKREAYIWKRTRLALERVRTLKHSREAIGRDQDEALVFVTRKGLPYIRRERIVKGNKIVNAKIANAVSITFGRLVKLAKVKGVIPANLKLTYYTLRHTFRTHADNCPDVHAVRRTMGRAIPGSDRKYIRGRMEGKRLKRVAIIVLHKMWPTQKSPARGSQPSSAALKPGQMRMVS